MQDSPTPDDAPLEKLIEASMIKDDQCVASIFKFYTLDEIDALPAMDWLAKGLLSRQGLGMAWGPPGNAKTFVILDLVLCCIKGNFLFAKEFGIHDALRVVYAAGEKFYGLKERLRAARVRHPLDEAQSANLRICKGVPQLFDQGMEANVDRFIAELRELYPDGFDVLLIDTLHTAGLGSEENSNSDVARMVFQLHRIQEAFGCAILIIHHANAAGGRERGASAWRGAVDLMLNICLENGGPSGVMTVEKVSEDEDGFAIRFKLVKVDPNIDSVAVEWEGRVASQAKGTRAELERLLRAHPNEYKEAKDWYALVADESVKKEAFTKMLQRMNEVEGPDRSGVVRQLKEGSKEHSSKNPYRYAFQPQAITNPANGNTGGGD